ncbi:MAG: hypothetical protein V3U20_07690 [Thermoplasmata archaeon]
MSLLFLKYQFALGSQREEKHDDALEGIEPADASLIILAEEMEESLLSNDYVLITVARARGVEG